MSAVLRCKMRVVEVLQSKGPKGEIEHEKLRLAAVTSDTPENKQWSRWTPAATFELYIDNPEAFDKVAKGTEVFVDITPAQPAA